MSETNSMNAVREAHALLHRPGRIVGLLAVAASGVYTGAFADDKPLYSWINDCIHDETVERIGWTVNSTVGGFAGVTNDMQRSRGSIGAASMGWREFMYVDFDANGDPLCLDDIREPLAFVQSFTAAKPILIHTGRGIAALWRTASWRLADERFDAKAGLAALAAKFENSRFMIDKMSYSPERTVRVPGSWNRRGTDQYPVMLLSKGNGACIQNEWAAIQEALLEYVPKPRKANPEGPGAPLDDDFDFDAFCSHFGIEIIAQHGDRYDIACPIKGERHTGSASVTSLFYDGSRLGFRCLHPDHESVSIGELVSELSSEHGPYEGAIFPQRDAIAVDDCFNSGACDEEGI